MLTVAEVRSWMQQIAPLELAESWDNVGLLLGDPLATVSRILTCLTLSGPVVQEAIEEQAEMVISHHPLPFKPMARITTESPTGQLVWQLARSGISVFSPHTAWDSAAQGINAQLAQMLGLRDVTAITPSRVVGLESLGAGRMGQLESPTTTEGLVASLATSIPDCRPRCSTGGGPVNRIGICCGSGGGLLDSAIKAGCDTLVTGEATYHACLEAQAAGANLVMIGHHASERFSLEVLAKRIQHEFPTLKCWPSNLEKDPVRIIDLARPTNE